MLQSATLAFCRPPIPTISHIDVLSFNPDTIENLSKTFKTSISDFLTFRKNVDHRHIPGIKIHIRKFSDQLSFCWI